MSLIHPSVIVAIAILLIQKQSSAVPNSKTEFDVSSTSFKLFDYSDELIDALSFVQSEKAAGIDANKTTESMLAKHHNNYEMYMYLSDLTRQYPEITRLYSIGRSEEDRELWVIEITKDPGEHKLLKPEFKYAANIHGNEVVGRELLLHLARLLCENYRAAQEEPDENITAPTSAKFVKQLLETTRIHLMPSINPDGYDQAEVGCMPRHYENTSGRRNAKNVNINRNFAPYSNITGEIRAIMEWSKSEPFVLSANLQGGALVASYPYDGLFFYNVYVATPDDDIFRRLASSYSESHSTMSNGQVCYDFCADEPEKFRGGITNGAQRRATYGTMQDWLYDHTNSFDTTLFLGCNQYPEASDLPQYWQYNKRALLNYIKQVHLGVRGTIKDGVTGELLPNVTVHVIGRQNNITSTKYGDYFRILIPGLYDIVFERENYITHKISISVPDFIAISRHILLQPVHQSPSENSPTTVAPTQSSSPTPVSPIQSSSPTSVAPTQITNPGAGELAAEGVDNISWIWITTFSFAALIVFVFVARVCLRPMIKLFVSKKIQRKDQSSRPQMRPSAPPVIVTETI